MYFPMTLRPPKKILEWELVPGEWPSTSDGSAPCPALVPPSILSCVPWPPGCGNNGTNLVFCQTQRRLPIFHLNVLCGGSWRHRPMPSARSDEECQSIFRLSLLCSNWDILFAMRSATFGSPTVLAAHVASGGMIAVVHCCAVSMPRNLFYSPKLLINPT
jgi:hypothetical protein